MKPKNEPARLLALLLLCLIAPLFAADNDALMNAAEKGNAAAVKALLATGANVNARNDDGVTALSLAIQNGHAETANVLRAAGAR